jgi:hypothetical protein
MTLIIIPAPSSRVVVYAVSHSAPFCAGCREHRSCQSCGRRSEAVALPAGPALPTLAEPNRQLQLPAPPSRASSQIPRAPSYAGSHGSNQAWSSTIRLSDEPLRPCDSSSHLSGPRSDVPRRTQSISSRSGISHRSARSDRSDRTALTADNLRRSANASGSRRWEPSRTERFVQEQPLAIMPPPPHSQVSSSSYRPSQSSRSSSSHRHEQGRLEWWNEPVPSQVSRTSSRRSSSRRGSSEYPGQRIETRSPPLSLLTSRSSSRRPDRHQGSSRDHYPRSDRRSSYSSSDSDDTIRLRTSPIANRVNGQARSIYSSGRSSSSRISSRSNRSSSSYHPAI